MFLLRLSLKKLGTFLKSSTIIEACRLDILYLQHNIDTNTAYLKVRTTSQISAPSRTNKKNHY